VTWDDVIALALGGMKLDPAVFWRLSMREWILLQRGFFDREESEYKTRWELARWQSYIATQIGGAKSIRRPEDLVRFPWDAPKEDPRMTEEEMQDFLKTMGSRIENGKFVN